MSESIIKNIILPDKSLLPKKFDYDVYLKLNPDLHHVITDEDSACVHYIMFGKQERRPYQYKHMINVDVDFDDNFYLSEYPDVAQYFRDAIHIPISEKLFHHYVNYGKNEGRFKNQHQQNTAFSDTDRMIDVKLYDTSLTNPINKLEAICLLTTVQEIKAKRFHKFIEHLLDRTTKTNLTNSLTFNIVINSNIDKVPLLSKLKSVFKQVKIIRLKLNKNDDIYCSDASRLSKMPKYGLKSGPNLCFFKTINYCRAKYNTCLFLETDCILGTDWIDKIYNYTKYSNGFLISGAIYDGEVFVKAGSAMMTHINGGSGLYATHHELLHTLCDLTSKFIIDQVANDKMPGLAYDYAIKLLIDYQLNNTTAKNKQRQFWQFINRNYIANKLIINCCTEHDQGVDIDYINVKYNPAVLHTKT